MVVVTVAIAVLIGNLLARRGPRTSGLPTAERPGNGLPAGYPPSSAPGDSPLALVTIDYPAEGATFPPDMTAPMYCWHDASPAAAVWRIDVAFADGSADIHAESPGPPPQIGEIDLRCVSATNELPELTPDETTAHTWTPDERTWAAIRRHAVERPAAVTIAGYADRDHPVSRGRTTIQISKDPVGAPIFYRDVPLMPTETSPGVISPLVKSALPLVSWRLRSVAEPRSRLLLQDMPTCANCHSFSRDGKTLGMDLDGPEGEKAIYALVSVAPQMSIRNRDVIRWDSFKNGPTEKRRGTGLRIGFMSQVSPDGEYVVTTLNSQEYVANFTDYRFLQVFYPTRGILAWYGKATGRIQTLPGADDPHYVQAGCTWSPDGKYLVFSRAEAKEAYPEGGQTAQHANDPNETPIQYDLYRIPFHAGQGGRAEPIAGASQNGMSNSFPKVSPDGRWIVFVQCRNGFLMRPDSQLYIVPAEGGKARRMRCNTRLMNSWHSFSPNGRWLVFASKSRGPYTRMFLTHLDAEGNDSPPILIENSTAANRAVNIPEFVNIASDGLLKIDVPATEVYRHFNLGMAELEKNSWSEKALAELRKALEMDPQLPWAHLSLGAALKGRGQVDEAIAHYEKALEINPDFAEAHYNLGVALADRGRRDEAIAHYREALDIKPDFAASHNNLGILLAGLGRFDEAIVHYRKVLEIDPQHAGTARSLALAQGQRERALQAFARQRELLQSRPKDTALLVDIAWLLAAQPNASLRNGKEALELAQRAVQLTGGKDPAALDALAAAYAEAGRYGEAVETAQKALDLAHEQKKQSAAEAISSRLKLYRAGVPFRAAPQPPIGPNSP
jgi:tetratricopeptide (TPR) repeat protein